MSAYLPYAARVRTLLSLLDVGSLAFVLWLSHWIRFNPAMRVPKLWHLLTECRVGTLFLPTRISITRPAWARCAHPTKLKTLIFL